MQMVKKGSLVSVASLLLLRFMPIISSIFFSGKWTQMNYFVVFWYKQFESRSRGYKIWFHSQTRNKVQWLAACGYVRMQPIIALYFEFENELKFYNLRARSSQTKCWAWSGSKLFNSLIVFLKSWRGILLWTCPCVLLWPFQREIIQT